MDKSERYLAFYQQSNVLSITSNSSSDELAFKSIPKLLSTTIVQQEHAFSVNKFFEEYMKQRHSDKDIKLLHGVWTNKEMDHSEIIKGYSNRLTIKTYDDFWINNEVSVRSNRNFYSSSNGNNRDQFYHSSIDKLKFYPSQSSSSLIESQKQVVQNPLEQFKRISLDLIENEDINNLSSKFQSKLV